MLDPIVHDKLHQIPSYKLKPLEDNLRLNGKMMEADEVSRIHHQKKLQEGAALEADREALENLGQQQTADNSINSGPSTLEKELKRLQTGEIKPGNLSKEALIAAYENDHISETTFASEFAQRD